MTWRLQEVELKEADYKFGVVYSEGRGVATDNTKAATYFLKAARKGSAWAQYKIAEQFYNGAGVEKDLVQAYYFNNLPKDNDFNGIQFVNDLNKRLKLDMSARDLANAKALLAKAPPVKSGKVSDLSNYRPISILTPISKLFESLISTKIMLYLESNSLLHPAQFAYRKKTSTEHAVLTMIEEWRKRLDEGYDVIAVFLDLSKAFDTVNHKILLTKLKYYGFHENFIKLIRSYLYQS